MKFIQKDKSNFSIEITPLIDIVFLLVIFFVVTSKVGEYQYLSLDLPKSESFNITAGNFENEISLYSDGSVIINNKILNITDIEQIESLILNFDKTIQTVIFNAENEALHMWVVSIMDILNRNNFDSVQIRTISQ